MLESVAIDNNCAVILTNTMTPEISGSFSDFETHIKPTLGWSHLHRIHQWVVLTKDFFFFFNNKRGLGIRPNSKYLFREHQPPRHKTQCTEVPWRVLVVYLSHFDNSVSFDSNETQYRKAWRESFKLQLKRALIQVHAQSTADTSRDLILPINISPYLRREPRTLETHCK